MRRTDVQYGVGGEAIHLHTHVHARTHAHAHTHTNTHTHTVNAQQCGLQLTCGDCIQTVGCAWCASNSTVSPIKLAYTHNPLFHLKVIQWSVSIMDTLGTT